MPMIVQNEFDIRYKRPVNKIGTPSALAPLSLSAARSVARPFFKALRTRLTQSLDVLRATSSLSKRFSTVDHA
jgi:hypothetical protein